jgi:hypothetical protein
MRVSTHRGVTMRTKLFVLAFCVAGLAVPAASQSADIKTQQSYELHGTLSAYTAATSLTPGSITILVSTANKESLAFVGLTLTFTLDLTTNVNPKLATIVDGDTGWVQLKGPIGVDATALQLLVPQQVVDQTAT